MDPPAENKQSPATPAAGPAERAEAAFRRGAWGGPPAVLPCDPPGPPPMTPIPILRHVPHEPAGTLEDALAAAGLEFRYVDLFDATPTAAQLDLDRVPGWSSWAGR